MKISKETLFQKYFSTNESKTNNGYPYEGSRISQPSSDLLIPPELHFEWVMCGKTTSPYISKLL